MLLLSMTLSCSADKCWLMLVIVSEALTLSVLKVKLEMQTSQHGLQRHDLYETYIRRRHNVACRVGRDFVAINFRE